MVTAARKIGDQLFAIQSFNGDNEYVVNLAGIVPSCTCPHYTMRLAGTDRQCKHIVSVIDQRPRIELLEKAARCTDDQLAGLLARYAEDPMISGALRVVREQRRGAAENEAKLRNVFV